MDLISSSKPPTPGVTAAAAAADVAVVAQNDSVRGKDQEAVVSMVDPFLVEALQNPSHRLTILRMELDIQKFLQNSDLQQFEFLHFPTSELRLAADRVAQHYGLQTMVKENVVDGLGTRILVRRQGESKYPAVCLSDIPAKQLENDKNEQIKIVTRSRPNKASQNEIGESDDMLTQVPSDRKNSCLGLEENEYLKNSAMDLEKNFINRDYGTSSRVAIFRDREKDRTDPDYDRSYERYFKYAPSNQAFNGDEFVGLAIPPLDPAFFAQDITLPDSNAGNFDQLDQNDDDGDVVLDGFDFDLDFCFDDILPGSLEQPLPDPAQFDDSCFFLRGSDSDLAQFQPDRDLNDVSRAFKMTSAEFPHVATGENVSGDGVIANSSSSPEQEVCELSGDHVSGDRSSGMDRISGDRGQDVSGYLNVSSPESNGSQSSGNCRSNVSEDSNKSVSSSPNLTLKNGVVDSKIKLEELNYKVNNSKTLLKRKKESDDLNNIDAKTSKFQKSSGDLINLDCNEENSNSNNNVLGEEEEKKKARLMRNRESAQLSRQRKKHYVEELEDKVKNMHSTIQDLNAKISYFMAENASLRQQMGSGGVAPPPMAGTPPPGMYPHPMIYPWMPCGVPPYMVKPQGSQVPLVPIPRLKPQQAASAPRVNKKAESKKSEGKTKKVASVSFLGLLFFVLLFGGLVPMVNMRFGGVRESFSGGSDSQFYEKHHGRVLTANGNMSSGAFGGGKEFVNGENGKERNGSEPLVASLYVPRNDKLVKIDGNLIIHSVLASEKAMASFKDPANKASSETSLAVPGELAHVVTVSGGRAPQLYKNPNERQRAIGKENLKSPATDGRLQEWFREGLAGPMLSSGMCTEVFHFDVSSASGPGAIVPVPATSRNVTVEQSQSRNSTHINKERNRRILRGLPITLPGSSRNISEDGGRTSQKESFNGNNSLSSMVVSVLVDPREVGDTYVDGVMGAKSLSRIFVVVLIDSVKYVTYSCMLPFKGAAPHLVTTQ